MKASIQFNILSLVAALFLFAGCEIIGSGERGNGNLVTSVLPVVEFDRVEVKSNFRITFHSSDRSRLEIEADENLHDNILATVEKGKLVIETVDEIVNLKGIKIDIYTENNLKSIECSGAGTIKSGNPLKVKDIDLVMSGAGLIDLEIEGRSVSTDLSGAGLVKIAGKIKNQKLDLSGAGSYNAFDLYSENCELDLSGLGNAEIYATRKADIELSGLGNVSVRGEPARINKSVSGLGKITIKKPGEDEKRDSGENYL